MDSGGKGDRQLTPETEDSKDGVRDQRRSDAPKRGYRACVGLQVFLLVI